MLKMEVEFFMHGCGFGRGQDVVNQEVVGERPLQMTSGGKEFRVGAWGDCGMPRFPCHKRCGEWGWTASHGFKPDRKQWRGEPVIKVVEIAGSTAGHDRNEQVWRNFGGVHDETDGERMTLG